MSTIRLTLDVDLAEGSEFDPQGTVTEALAHIAQRVTLGETAGDTRTAEWWIGTLRGEDVTNLGEVLDTYLADFHSQTAKETDL